MSEEKFQPEIGQALFGNPHKEYPVPDIWDAALSFISDEPDRVMWNTTQKEYSSPFGNTGNKYDSPVFSVHAYDWGAAFEMADEADDGKDTSGMGQPWNFKWRDIEISWYKYQGRGMSSNKPLSPELAAQCIKECCDYLRTQDVFNE